MNNRGDEADEMGDYLNVVDLGLNFYVEQVGCSPHHCCVLSTEHQLKCMVSDLLVCWDSCCSLFVHVVAVRCANVQGQSNYGQLGYEDTEWRGDEANEMGDFLHAVNLGDDFAVKSVAFLHTTTCVFSTIGNVKCFGRNHHGQLGYGDTTSRGDTSGSMGNALSVVDIGSGFSESGFHFASNSGHSNHVCVIEQTTELLAKCWGNNGHGQLGYGNSNDRGDGSNEMGDYLPFIALDFTAIERTTVAPTTAAPSSTPPTTAAPTSTPPTTAAPTAMPTEQCDADAMYSVNWHNLVRAL